MRIAASWVTLAVVCAALCGGCERKIEEPPPRSHTTTDTASGDPKAKKIPACARPTPDKAVREVQGPVPNPDCPVDPGPVPELARGKVKFSGADGAPEVALEIAEKDADRQRGLMFRKEMPEMEGMLFVFAQAKPLSFWMHNTCLPLDMIYVGEDFTIVNIEENTPTLSDQTFPSNCPAKYVIEVNAGWTRKHGVKVGQKVAIER